MRGKGILEFLRTDIWRIQEGELPRLKALVLRYTRIMVLSFRGVFEDKCQLRASALTYYSLLSIVPVLALVLAIAKGFGFERILEHQLLQNMQAQQEVASRIIGFARGLLENTQGGLMVGAGLLFLFWVMLNLFSNIEDAFNHIWGIRRGRTISRKLTDYLALTLVGPFLFTFSSTATVVIGSQFQRFVERIPVLEAASPAFLHLFKLVPYIALWILFTFMYAFMPNTKVNIRCAIFAGVVAGSIYGIFQWAYITFQIGVARYNAIFGSFAALPLFLIWVHWSWLIVLYGAEISFAHQNVQIFEFERDWSRVSYYRKKLLALAIVHYLVRNFSNKGGAKDEGQISEALGIPLRCVREILSELVNSRLISQVSMEDKKSIYYQPGLDLEKITLKSVLDAMEQSGSDKIPMASSPALDKMTKSLEKVGRMIESSPANIRLKDI